MQIENTLRIIEAEPDVNIRRKLAVAVRAMLDAELTRLDAKMPKNPSRWRQYDNYDRPVVKTVDESKVEPESTIYKPYLRQGDIEYHFDETQPCINPMSRTEWNLALANKKIPAVKAYIDRHKQNGGHISLTEAKDFIEKHWPSLAQVEKAKANAQANGQFIYINH